MIDVGLHRKLSRGAFDNAIEVICTATGTSVPKRQSLNIVKDVAADFESFYQKIRFEEPENTSDLLVLSFDGTAYQGAVYPAKVGELTGR